jgi:hypothetical protein
MITEGSLLYYIELIHKDIRKMAIDLSNLTAQEHRLVADVNLLLTLVSNIQTQLAALQASTTDPAVQAALDAITADISTEAAKVETVTAPPAAPTGATGPAPAGP